MLIQSLHADRVHQYLKIGQIFAWHMDMNLIDEVKNTGLIWEILKINFGPSLEDGKTHHVKGTKHTIWSRKLRALNTNFIKEQVL